MNNSSNISASVTSISVGTTTTNVTSLTTVMNIGSTTAANASLYERPFNEAGIIFSAVILLTFMVIGVVGNTLTIIVIGYYKELRENVFMRLILSLCVSDLISAMISWLFLYRRTWGFDVWLPLPDLFCKFYWAADIMTSYVTALHVLSFSILRFISIKFPIVYNQIKLKHGNIWMVVIWLVCIVAGFIPCWFIFGSRTKDLAYRERNYHLPYARWPACTALETKLEAYTLYQKVGYSIFLYVPIIGVVVMCLSTLTLVAMRSNVALNKTNQAMKRRERQGVIQLLLIIFSFLLGYIPFTVYEFWSVGDYPPTPFYSKIDYWFGMVGYFFLRFSECLNPLFYNLSSTKVRSYTKKFFYHKIDCRRISKNKPVKHSHTVVTFEPISTIRPASL